RNVAQQPGNLYIRISFLFEGNEKVFRDIVELVAAQFGFEEYQFLYLREKPLINIGGFTDGFERYTQFKGIFDVEEAVAARVFEAIHNFLEVAALPSIGTQSATANFQTLAGLLKRFNKCAPNRHHFTNGFHLQAKFP